MKDYLEKIMHQSIEEKEYEDTGKLPLGCRKAFNLSILKTGQQEFLLAAPVEDMSLTELRKMRLQLEKCTYLAGLQLLPSILCWVMTNALPMQ